MPGSRLGMLWSPGGPFKCMALAARRHRDVPADRGSSAGTFLGDMLTYADTMAWCEILGPLGRQTGRELGASKMGLAPSLLLHTRRRSRQKLGKWKRMQWCLSLLRIFAVLTTCFRSWKGTWILPKCFDCLSFPHDLDVYFNTCWTGGWRFFWGRVERIWSWLAQHRDEVVGYAVVDDMDLSEESDATGLPHSTLCQSLIVSLLGYWFLL